METIKELSAVVEIGSDITLNFIKKDITRDQILKSIELCKKVNLKSFTSFMIGFPDETDEEMEKTLSIYDEMRAIDSKNVRINGMFIYSPFPGTELYRYVIKNNGYNPPQSLQDWSKYKLYDSSNITWFNKSEKRKMQTISILVRYFFSYKSIMDLSFSDIIKRHGGFFKTLASVIFNNLFYPLAVFRWKCRWFSFGIEMKIWQKVYLLYMGRN